MSVDRRRSTSNQNLHRRRPKDQNLAAGRSGPGWDRCRAQVIAGAGGRCAICSRPLVPGAPRSSDWETEVDHYPIPLHVMRDDYKAGRVSLATFNGRANDPNGCRAVHRQCHMEFAPDLPLRPLPDEDGLQDGAPARMVSNSIPNIDMEPGPAKGGPLGTAAG
jgi:hypothetical protein